eukprot:7389468-Alexandrium_andersonii.AAC.1
MCAASTAAAHRRLLVSGYKRPNAMYFASAARHRVNRARTWALWGPRAGMNTAFIQRARASGVH